MNLKQKVFMTILESRKRFTNYKIIITSETFEIYIENVFRQEEEQAIKEVKMLLDVLKKILYSDKLSKKELEKVTLSKGYEIIDNAYRKKFCGKPVDIVHKNIGVSLRFLNRAVAPLIIYTYLVDETDIDKFMENSANYIDILAEDIL